MNQIAKKEKCIKIVTIILVIAIALSVILPMVLLRGQYIFPIHDNLDSSAGNVQSIYNTHSFFSFNKGQSFSGGINDDYRTMTYNLTSALECLTGFLPSMIIIRIFSVVVGFLGMLLLLKRIFHTDDVYQNSLFFIIAIAYAVTSSAPNREVAFATLPVICYLFIRLMDEKKLNMLVLLAFIYPFTSVMNSFLVFIIPLWFLATLVLSIGRQRLHGNLNVAFVLMCVGTVLSNLNSIWISLIADDTNRSLMSEASQATTVDWEKIESVLLYGQYHSTPLHGYILLPFTAIASIYVLIRCIGNIQYFRQIKVRAIFVFLGWLYWFFSAVVNVVDFSTGITLIDGFGWARCITLMRLIWYGMIALLISCIGDDRTEEKKSVKVLILRIVGIMCSLVLSYYLLKKPYSTYLDDTIPRNMLDAARFILLLMFIVTLFTKIERKYVYVSVYALIVLQCAYLFVANTTYNDVGLSTYAWCSKTKDDSTINFDEFFSTEMFEEIKSDIQYDPDEEWVMAYGFHPSVLMYNGFKTIDRYKTLHSMRDQTEFREIIAPALDMYPEYESYYDSWGGRMYLYGEVDFKPTRYKYSKEEEHTLYIDTEAFKKYNGRYILSRTSISNADDIGLEFVKDYDSVESFYHIYLYKAR